MSTPPQKVALFQFNVGVYTNQSYLPYSAGMLWSYAHAQPEVAAAYGPPTFHVLREDPTAIVESFDHVDVAAFSAYLWNWELSHAVAKGLRRRFPGALILFGGPQVPNDARDFLAKHPWVDIAVHGEGELTFADILKARAAGGDYGEIPWDVLRRRVGGLPLPGGGARAPHELGRYPLPVSHGGIRPAARAADPVPGDLGDQSRVPLQVHVLLLGDGLRVRAEAPPVLDGTARGRDRLVRRSAHRPHLPRRRELGNSAARRRAVRAPGRDEGEERRVPGQVQGQLRQEQHRPRGDDRARPEPRAPRPRHRPGDAEHG